MHIERIVIDILDRKENIKNHRNNIEVTLEDKYYFSISSIIVDHENNSLHLKDITFHNELNALKQENEVIDLIKKNINTIIYKFLI